MTLRFVTPNQHGIGDHLAATGLIVAPFLLGLGASSPLALWISVGMGFFLISYSLITRYRLGIVKLLPFPGHLAIDWFDAVIFFAAPFLFGFSGLDFYYYIAVGISVVGIVVVTMPQQPADQSRFFPTRRAAAD